MNFHHPLLRCAVFVIVYLCCALLLGGLAGSVLPLFPLSRLDAAIVGTAVGGLLSVAAATALMLALVEQRSFAFVGLSLERGWVRQTGLGVLLGFLMIGTVAAATLVSGQVQLQRSGAFNAARLGYVVLMFLLAAAREELLFRGYGFQRLVEALGPVPSVAGLSVLFGLVHRNNPSATALGILNTMLVGILLSLAYLRTRRLWMAIGVHWAWNLAEASWGFPVSGIKIEAMPLVAGPLGHPLMTGGSYGPEASLLGTLVILAGTAAVALAVRPAAGAPEDSSHA